MSNNTGRDKTKSGGCLNNALVHLAIMAIVMAFLFLDSFKTGFVTFSNDSPLGNQVAQWDQLISNLWGTWQPLNWFGGVTVSNRPTISIFAGALVGNAIVYAKFFTPFALWLLGACAYFCFRQMGFRPPVCLLGGLAAMLNMNAFSNACWGLPYWQVARGMAFMAFGLVVCQRIRQEWIRYILAGACIGIGVMEGYDIGAIFSVFVAALAFARLDSESQAPAGPRLLKGGLVVAVMAVAAAVVATHAIHSLVTTQVQGVAGTGQDEKTKQERWGFATQWSLPKMEVLRFVIPGLFGYRMDEPDGGQYWGRVGENPQIEKIKNMGTGNPQAAAMLQSPTTYRYSGSGEHIGVVVVLGALWAFFVSFFKGRSSYSDNDRYFIWCVAGFSFISLLLAFGRYGFLYQIFFELPYASTIRNPIKFTQPMHMGMCILFAYGLNDLWVRFVERAGGQKPETFGDWWKGTTPVERNWFYGCGALVALSLFSLIVYASKRSAVEKFMVDTALGAEAAKVIFDFSLVEVVIFLFFLVSSVVVIGLIQRGTFAGRQAGWALVVLVGVLVADLARSNAHWIKHVDYKQKYAENVVFNRLKEQPEHGRVSALINAGIPSLNVLQQVYRVNWLHQHFPFFKIQSLDVSQESRVGQDKQDYLTAIQTAPLRYWQLSNTRYLLTANVLKTQQGELRYVDVINQQLDPQLRRFKVDTAFDFYQEPNNPEVLVQPKTNGAFALLEFTGTLPRAKLYWKTETQADDVATLARLKDSAFDPASTVLLAESIDTGPPESTGSAKIVTYEPKRVVIETEASSAAVLLLNDRYHPDWRAFVDGKEEKIVRANHIARGVKIPAGQHRVEFRFEPPAKPLYVSIFGLITVIALIGYVAFGPKQAGSAVSKPELKQDDEPPAAQPDKEETSEAEGAPTSKHKKRKGKRRR